MNKKVMDKAWLLQHHLDKIFDGFMRSVSLSGYLFCLGMLFMLVGLMLFIFVLVVGVSFALLCLFSNPLFYLGLGVTCVFVFLFIRFFERKEGVVK